MIGRITGILLEKTPPQILVDVHGIGYEIEVPMSTFYNLPATGSTLSLHTHQVVREDAQLLYGFASEDERQAFRQLIKVSGIGARIALAVLSGLSVSELAAAVREQQSGRLTRIPGIGKKTAERLLLELRDKLGNFPAVATANLGARMAEGGDSHGDILNALLALGYKEREALAAMKGLEADVSVPEGIRLALRQLSPG